MKKLIGVSFAFLAISTFFGCNFTKQHANNTSAPVENPGWSKDRTKQKYDGIKEAMNLEFEQTKDVKLGYVPASNLVNEVYRHELGRRSGRLARLSALTWVERGPNTNSVGPSNGNIRGPANNAVTSGRTRALWFDLNDPSRKTVWLGAVSGGLWKTTDISASPANWTLISDFFGNLAVTAICQDPLNKNILYFGTGEKTFNADAVRGGGVWKSTDNGVTWNLLTNTVNFYNVSRVVCDATGNVYVATIGGGSGIQRSSDGGATWVNITPSGLTTRVTEMRLSSTGRLHIVCGYRNSGISGHRFADNPSTVTAGTWTEPLTTYPTTYNTELTVAGNTLYALPADANYRTPVIYKSTDGGLNWAQTITSPPSGTSDSDASPSINTGQGWYDLAIGADPANPDLVIAGGLNYFKSENGGVSWARISRWVGNTVMYVHADHHAVVWDGNQVLLGTDGGVFYSSDNGFSFTDRNVGVRTKQFYSCAIHPSQTNYFLGGTQDNGTHQLNSPGLGASVEVLGGDGGFVHIDENEPQYQFGATTYANYRRSVNGGAAWSSVSYSSSIGQFINPTDYDDMNNKMYTSASVGSYVRWDDPQTGATFRSVSISSGTSSAVTSIKVSPSVNNRVYFGSSEARVVRVDNAHQNFPTVTNISGSNFPASGNTVSCINTGTTDDYLLATFSNYNVAHVFVSTTGGGASGWADITGNLPNVPVRWAMFYPEDNDKAIIATEMGIFETDDINGSSTDWVRNSTFPVVRTNMLQYRHSDKTLLAATHGRGMWTTQLPLSTPYIRFAGSYKYTSAAEGTTASGEVCRNYRDITIPMRIDAAPTGNATVTLSIQAGGTAIQGLDYDFTTNGNFASPSSTLLFNSGATADQNITVRIYNDAEVEGAESFTFNYAISGSTNAIAAPSSQSYTVTFTDDDVAPVASLYSGNFNIGQSETTLSDNSPFRTDRSRFRVQYLFTASELTSAGMSAEGFIRSMTISVITKNSTQPFTGFTISMANTTATTLNTGFNGTPLTQVYSANYSTSVGVNLFNFTTPFYWDGVSNLLVNICYDKATAESSADLVDATSAPFGNSNSAVRASTWSNAISSSGCSLAAAYIDYNRITTTFNAVSGNSIASTAGTNRSEYVGGSGVYSFYNGFDIIARMGAASRNFGCVNAAVAEAGNSWQTFFAGTRSQKIFNINYSGAPDNSSYQLSAYFTSAELGGKDPNSIRLAGTIAGTIAGANSSNTNVYNSSVTNFGTGYVFTATVYGPGLYFLTEAAVTPVRIFTRTTDLIKLLQNPVGSYIPVQIGNAARVNVGATLLGSNGQVLQRWNLGRADGVYQLSFGKATIAAGVYILRIDAGTKTQSIKLVKQ
ncbi:T9SS type A sorting domain-containing protein [Lacibacter luteus]|uniref:T9SS type A sorting domain-containing protein n=1 Tax=Lacibacter luteus TaxID=2508719 RepID=A0A4Q1CDW5_9BACT|nr:T9SS type A sorting domain-containing protein [Lacibacter luteus]RXK57593.1 T9SS type A sorting domain-containing protein [Lacibacter luteus]